MAYVNININRDVKIDMLELVDNFHLGWNGLGRSSSSLVIYTEIT